MTDTRASEVKPLAWGLFNPMTGKLDHRCYQREEAARAGAATQSNRWRTFVAVPLFLYGEPSPATPPADVVKGVATVVAEAVNMALAGVKAPGRATAQDALYYAERILALLHPQGGEGEPRAEHSNLRDEGGEKL